MKRTLLITLGAVGATLLSMQVTQAQVPIYREVFGNASGGPNSLLNTVGWFGAWGGNAADSSNPSPNNFGISSALGDPQNLDNINAGGPAASMANGLLFTSGTGAALTNWIAYTTAYTVDTTATPVQDISFYAGNAANGSIIPGFRVAVQIDGNWYASSQVLANTVGVSSAANFNSQAQQVTFNWTTDASAWVSLDFTPGTTLALGSTLASPLPGDNITAFGLYSDASGTATRRVDTFQIDAVPEPGSVVLVMLGAGMLIGLRRSRKA